MVLWETKKIFLDIIQKSFLKLSSKKAKTFFEIFTLLFSVCTADKSKVKISQNFVAFSEYTKTLPQVDLLLEEFDDTKKTFRN